MVQWLRTHLPMQGTQVRSLVQEDSACCGATKPTCSRACAPQQRSHRNKEPRCRLQRAAATHCNHTRFAQSNEDPGQPKKPITCFKREKAFVSLLKPEAACSFSYFAHAGRALGNLKNVHMFKLLLGLSRWS